jgi:hypothetical protein
VFFNKNAVELIRAALPRYTDACTFTTEKVGEEAADEAFDLTNNPSRQKEREEKYGRGRSVSSGDVIEVDGVKWACMSIGWERL